MCGPMSSTSEGLAAAIASGGRVAGRAPRAGRASAGLSWSSSGMSHRLRRRVEGPQAAASRALPFLALAAGPAARGRAGAPPIIPRCTFVAGRGARRCRLAAGRTEDVGGGAGAGWRAASRDPQTSGIIKNSNFFHIFFFFFKNLLYLS
jgi:hypothetical protein